MRSPIETRHLSPRLRLAILCAATAAYATWLAWRSAPLWDDAWIALARTSALSFGAQFADRPLVGWVLDLCNRTRWFWPLNYVAHWLHWTALSLTAAWFWLRFVSSDVRLAAAAALLVVAPVACETQLIAASLTWNVLAPVVLGYAALVTAFEARRSESVPAAVALRTAAVVAVLVSCLMSEYGIPTALLAAMVLAVSSSRRGLRTRLALPAVVVGAAAIGYALLWSSVDVLRPDTRPELVLSAAHLPYLLKISAARLVDMVWRLGLGESLEALGSIRIGSSWGSAAAVAAGGALAAAALVTVGKKSPDHAPIGYRPVLLLVAALVTGLMPVVLMRRDVLGWASSRFWVPVLPLAACLTAWCWGQLLHRFSSGTALALAAFLAGHHLWLDASLRRLQNRELDRIGAVLSESIADDGLTIAIPLGGTTSKWSDRNDFDLTFHLTRKWDPASRARFWALPSWSWAATEEALDLTRPCIVPFMHRRYKGIERRGEVRRVLWIDTNPSSEEPLRRLQQFPDPEACDDLVRPPTVSREASGT